MYGADGDGAACLFFELFGHFEGVGVFAEDAGEQQEDFFKFAETCFDHLILGCRTNIREGRGICYAG